MKEICREGQKIPFLPDRNRPTAKKKKKPPDNFSSEIMMFVFRKYTLRFSMRLHTYHLRDDLGVSE